MSKESGRQFVAQSRHGENQLRLFGISFDFLPQTGDVNVHRSSKCFGAVAPDVFENVAARHGDAAMFHEVSQELELAGGERNLFAVAEDTSAGKIDGEPSDPLNRLWRVRISSGASQQRLHASEQLHRVEGLGDIIVGPDLQ